MKDFLGNKLEVGDYCVCTEPGYKNFVNCLIVDILKKQIRVKLLLKEERTKLKFPYIKKNENSN